MGNSKSIDLNQDDISFSNNTLQDTSYGAKCNICGQKLPSISNDQRCMTWYSLCIV